MMRRPEFRILKCCARLLPLALWMTAGECRAEASPRLVKDIGSTPRDWASGPYAKMGDFVYLQGYSNATGAELWKSDGTTEGTVMVKELAPGTASSAPSWLTAAGDTLFFTASASGAFTELWKSDGTASGTALVKDINPTGSASPSILTAWGSRVAFTANDGIHGRELWVSDGTDAGTTMVGDLSPGSSSTSIEQIAGVGERLFFTATPAGQPRKLYVTDPETGVPAIFEESRFTSVANLSVLAGFLHFNAIEVATSQRRLWVSDGTPAGTRLLSTTAVTSSSYAVPMGSRFYFLTEPYQNQAQLWRDNGQGGPAVFIKNVGDASSLVAAPPGLGTLSALYFVGSNSDTGNEIWRSDGTAAGTGVLAESNPGTGDGYPGSFTFAGDRLYFRADEGDGQRELWMSDGSPGGTVRIRRFARGIHHLIASGEQVLFAGDDGITGQEFWGSDGTAAGTRVVKDFRGTVDAAPDALVAAGERLFFRAKVPMVGGVIHATDGTEAGTTASNQLAYISTAISHARTLGNELIFTSENRDSDYELWKSDGTAAGPVQIKNIRAAGSSAPKYLTTMSGYLLFNADDGIHGAELWRTDGSGAGTVMVKDIVAGAAGSNPTTFTRVGESLYFLVSAGSATELWKSDGTGAGTIRVKSFATAISRMTPVGSHLFFRVAEGFNGQAIWKSDGTEAGTIRVTAQPPAFQADVSGVSTWVGAGDLLYFIGVAHPGQVELWRCDGTEGGTIRIQETLGGITSWAPGLSVVNDRLLYWVDDRSGFALWASDGTRDGTRKLRDVTVESATSVTQFEVSGVHGFFLAGGESSGYRLWRTDGTPDRTGLVLLEGAPAWKASTDLCVAGSGLYFPLETDEHGLELFMLPLAEISTAEDAYRDWIVAEGVAGEDSAPGLAPQGDNVVNLLKYAFFMRGAAPDVAVLVPGSGTGGLPFFSVREDPGGGKVLRVEFVRRKDSGLTYMPKWSASLEAGSFQAMTGSPLVTEIDAARERVIVEHPVDPVAGSRCFGIVEVTGL